MILNEMFDEELDDDKYMDPATDNEVPKLDDLRKTKLTLGQINRFRLIQDVRDFEQRTDLENIRMQYGTPANSEGGGL